MSVPLLIIFEPLRPITVLTKLPTVTRTRWPIVGLAGSVMVCPAALTYTCVLTVAVNDVAVTTELIPTATLSPVCKAESAKVPCAAVA